jgi:hypothetical protein
MRHYRTIGPPGWKQTGRFLWEIGMGDVVKLVAGRSKAGAALPKPKLCKTCEEPIETARLQVTPGARRCIACQRSHERDIDVAGGIVGQRGVIVIKG